MSLAIQSVARTRPGTIRAIGMTASQLILSCADNFIPSSNCCIGSSIYFLILMGQLFLDCSFCSSLHTENHSS